MKVLLVTPYFYPKTGGLENYVYNIAKGLQKKYKWEIVVVTSNHKAKKDIREKLEGITVYRLSSWFALSNTPINPLWYYKIKYIIHKENPNLINAHAPVPFIADLANIVSGSIPFIVTYHAGTMKKGKFIQDSIISIYERFFLPHLFKNAKKIICASEFVKKGIVKKYIRKSTVITPAVDTNIFKPQTKIKKDNIILFVGRYANVYNLKGLSYLLEAVKNIPNIKLHIVGEKIQTDQKNVRFLGVKSANELVKEMQKSKVLVLPSIAPMESFGMVLVEAMACKTPIIGTRMGGIPEIISNGRNGLLVPIKNSKSLEKAITIITNNEDLSKKMENYGYGLIKEKYLWKYKVDQTHKLFMEVIK